MVELTNLMADYQDPYHSWGDYRREIHEFVVDRWKEYSTRDVYVEEMEKLTRDSGWSELCAISSVVNTY